MKNTRSRGQTRKQLQSAKILGICAGAAFALTPESAEACGGLFCSSASPVNQTAERIIFAQDDDNNITQIVEVVYAGEAERFAWVLPVPGVPTPGVSSVVALDRLQQQTNPRYSLNVNFPDTCGGDGDSAEGVSGPPAFPSDDGADPSVQVLDAGTVGPYDFETISVSAGDADPADVALEWLNENGYDLGERAAEVLGPYLANGLNLIAFRLTSGAETGSIRPITLKYKAQRMAIPIRPTAVAAADDMPILVWVLGKNRAVPTNYRSLELNELLIDWFNPGNSYDLVVSAAAKEAGGQGFVTELAGPAGPLSSAIYFEWETVSAVNYQGRDFESNMVQITQQYGTYDGFLDVVRAHVPLREGVTPEAFATCAYCYFYPGDAWMEGFGEGVPGQKIATTDPIYGTNTGAFLAAVSSEVMQPIQDVADLFSEFDTVTRLYTTMSAQDMTLDPTFEFNPEAGEVSNVHVAEQDVGCDGGSGDWRVTLQSGEEVFGRGNTWPYALETTDLPANARILQYSTSGAPEVVTDNTATIQSVHDESDPGSGTVPSGNKQGGCAIVSAPSNAPSLGWWTLAALATFALARRRHRVAPVRTRF